MINEEQEKQIWNALLGALTEEQQEEFNQTCRDDPEFRAAYEERARTTKYLKPAFEDNELSDDELAEQLMAEMEEDFSKEEPALTTPVPSSTSRLKPWYALAALVVIALALTFVFRPTGFTINQSIVGTLKVRSPDQVPAKYTEAQLRGWLDQFDQQLKEVFAEESRLVVNTRIDERLDGGFRIRVERVKPTKDEAEVFFSSPDAFETELQEFIDQLKERWSSSS